MTTFAWRVLVVGSLAVILSGAGAKAAGKKIDFDKAETGKMPAGFTAALTGEGGPVAWMIAEDPTAPSPPRMLAQSSTETTANRFPLCVYDAVTAKDLAASVRFKVVAGKVAKTGGLAVRLRGPDDYYVVSANALGDRVSLEKLVGGKRSRVAGARATVSPDEWHTLKLEARGRHFVVSLDGKRLFEGDDAALAGPGKVALSTEGDSVTFFDDLEIEERVTGVQPDQGNVRPQRSRNATSSTGRRRVGPNRSVE